MEFAYSQVILKIQVILLFRLPFSANKITQITQICYEKCIEDFDQTILFS